jgi:hypothetical protein
MGTHNGGAHVLDESWKLDRPSFFSGPSGKDPKEPKDPLHQPG